MIVLAFDTAAAGCSVAVWRDGEVLASVDEAMARGQAEALMPMIVGAMAEADLAFSALDLIAVTVGPGSFTGVRVGLAAARGLALVTGLPVVGVASTEAVAHAVSGVERAGRSLLVVLESQRSDLYMQLFAPDLTPLGPPMSAPVERIAGLLPTGPVLIAGDAGHRLGLQDMLGWGGDVAFASSSSGGDRPSAVAIAGIAAGSLAATALPPVPLYLRPPDVSLPSPARGVS